MRKYRCPMCGQEIAKDLILFRKHTDAHIIDAIKKRHPGWVESDGACRKCVEYYREQLEGRDKT